MVIVFLGFPCLEIMIHHVLFEKKNSIYCSDLTIYFIAGSGTPHFWQHYVTMVCCIMSLYIYESSVTIHTTNLPIIISPNDRFLLIPA